MNEKKIMRRAAGANPDANGRPDGFDHLARRRPFERPKCVAPLEMP
jgi:hypothetical protein